MATPKIESLTIPKKRNKLGWFVYTAIIEGQYVEFRFDYRPSLDHVRRCMLSKMNYQY